MNWTRVAAVFWGVVTLGLHSIPRAGLVRLPGHSLAAVGGADKVAHVGMFAVLAALWCLAFPRRPGRVFLAGVAYGAALEFYQHLLIPGRTGSPADLLADTLGLALGVLAVRLAGRTRTGQGPV